MRKGFGGHEEKKGLTMADVRRYRDEGRRGRRRS
jgi:hypothetical protein